MCIGCVCEGFMFADIFGTRIQGPVDNMHGYDFTSVIDLFNGKLFAAILTNNIDKKEINKYYHDYIDDDKYFRYYCTKDNNKPWNWRTVHTNFELEKRKQSFIERINNFNNFYKELDDDSWYFYTVADGDNYLTENDINKILNELPQSVINKLIIISGLRFNIPKFFYNHFRCIHYNFDLNDNWWTNETRMKWKKLLNNELI